MQDILCLPSDLWRFIYCNTDIASFSRIRQTCKLLHHVIDCRIIWQFHASVSGIVEPVLPDANEWMLTDAIGMPDFINIDWRSLIKLSCVCKALPRPFMSYVWVRVGMYDIRLPHINTSRKCLEDNLKVLLKMPCGKKFFRLRKLQLSGRPGPIVDVVTENSRLLFEWSIADGPWWLLPSAPRCPQGSTKENRPQTMALSQVLGSQWLPPGGIWICIRLLQDTIADLCVRISDSLFTEGVDCRGYEVLLSDVSKPMAPSKLNPSTSLRDTCWVHGERLNLVKCFLKKGCEKASLQQPSMGNYRALILIQREEEPFTWKVERNRSQESGSARAPRTQPANVRQTSIERPSTVNTYSIHETSAGEKSEPEVEGLLRRPSDSETPEASATTVATGASPQAGDVPRNSGYPPEPVQSLRQFISQVDQRPPSTAELPTTSPNVSHSERVEIKDRSSAPADGSECAQCASGEIRHHAVKVLQSSSQARQFEFHRTHNHLMLTGNRGGVVSVLHTEKDKLLSSIVVDSCPVLGLCWMRHHPHIAACGTAQSGIVRLLNYSSKDGLKQTMSIKSFPQLSSLTANCTDDFLLASGFTNNVAIYDVETGKQVHEIESAHDHFINISRFANTSPHIFATASFDHTCRIWDLRRPMRADAAVHTLHTGGLNVMCSFAPDDSHILCSGVDTRLAQFQIPSFERAPHNFCIRQPKHQSRYRRFAYFEDGRRFVTAATDESHAMIMSTTGHNLGTIDFKGFMAHQKAANTQSAADAKSEYVQSLRTHPEDNDLFGVLMLTTGRDPSSAIGLVRLEGPSTKGMCPW